MGYGSTKHDTYLKYIVHRSVKLVGWYSLTALIPWTVYFVYNYHNDVTTWEGKVYTNQVYIHTSFNYFI